METHLVVVVGGGSICSIAVFCTSLIMNFIFDLFYLRTNTPACNHYSVIIGRILTFLKLTLLLYVSTEWNTKQLHIPKIIQFSKHRVPVLSTSHCSSIMVQVRNSFFSVGLELISSVGSTLALISEIYGMCLLCSLARRKPQTHIHNMCRHTLSQKQEVVRVPHDLCVGMRPSLSSSL